MKMLVFFNILLYFRGLIVVVVVVVVFIVIVVCLFVCLYHRLQSDPSWSTRLHRPQNGLRLT